MKYFFLTVFTFFAMIFGGCDIITDAPTGTEINSIPVLNGKINKSDYQRLLVNRQSKYRVLIELNYKDEYYKGQVEPQGAGSKYYPKWSYEIILPQGTFINGYNHFNLSAQVGDPSFLQTTVTSFIYRKLGFLVFNSDDVFFRLNGEDKGLYKMIERINQNFFMKRSLPLYELIKVGFDAQFSFESANDLNKNFDREYPDDDNLQNLAKFISVLDTVSPPNAYSVVSQYLNIENYLAYHAAATIIAHLDGFRNNMYLYKPRPDSPYEVLPWDFDRVFSERFDQIYFGENEIIDDLLQNEKCQKIYKDKYISILNNLFTEEELFPVIDSAYGRIKDAHFSDPNLGAFGGGIDLKNEVSILKNFISKRRQLLISKLNSFPF